MFTYDGEKTAGRIRSLQQYYDNNVLLGCDFVCESKRICKGSIGQGFEYYEGQLSHVGDRYDLAVNGQELRLVITGISYGHCPPKVDMERRRETIVEKVGMRQRFYGRKHVARNPHMRGTTLLLRRVLGGEASIREYSDWKGEFAGGEILRENHIYNMFALVNLLLCSACAGSARDRSSATMRSECFKHYMNTLRILRPTMVIFETLGSFEPLVRDAGLAASWHRRGANWGYFDGDGLEFVVCEFYHPSHPMHLWGCQPGPYFRETVLPTLSVALHTLGVE